MLSPPAALAAQCGSDESAATSPTIEGLSVSERRILVALSGRPLGLQPAESVSIAAGVCSEDVGEVLAQLAQRGLVTAQEELTDQPLPVHPTIVWRLNTEVAWALAGDAIRSTPLPEPASVLVDGYLPAKLWHLFWWGDPALIRLPEHAEFVAMHIFNYSDVRAWGWALSSLPADSLAFVAACPQTPDAQRRLIENALSCRDASPE